MGSIWRDFSATPPDRIFQVILEAVLQDKPDKYLCHLDREILVEDRRKVICDNLLKPGRTKEGRVEGELNIDSQKGDDSRVPV